MTQNEFIKKAISIHGDAFDYCDTVFTTTRGMITIKCNRCGDVKNVVANYHLRKDRTGCKCSFDKSYELREQNKKYCTCCCKIKPYEAFAKNKSTKDGLQGTCKDCFHTGKLHEVQIISNRAYRNKNKDNPEWRAKQNKTANKNMQLNSSKYDHAQNTSNLAAVLAR